MHYFIDASSRKIYVADISADTYLIEGEVIHVGAWEEDEFRIDDTYDLHKE